MIDKARGLPTDQVFLDIEDAVAPLAKPDARRNIVAALNEGGWGDTIRTVRVNDWTTQWTYVDVVEVVEGAGANLDAIMLPKVQTAEQVVALDLLLTQVEKATGLEVGAIGIEAQIENALGLTERDGDRRGLAARRDHHLRPGRLHGLDQHEVASWSANSRSGYDVGDAYHHILMSDPHGGPGATTSRRSTVPTCRSVTSRGSGGWPGGRPRSASTASGCCTRARSTPPTRSSARARPTTTTPRTSSTPTTSTPPRSAARRGAVMLGDEMIDEASRKMALVISAKGRAAGMTRQQRWERPDGEA